MTGFENSQSFKIAKDAKVKNGFQATDTHGLKI